jgi:hypothetical protein
MKVAHRILAVCVVFVSTFGASVQAADRCDRSCLEDHVNTYLSALIAHDPNRLRFARNVAFTENGQQLRIGDGLWATASALGSYRLYFADVSNGEAGFFGTLRENGVPILLALRLKIEGRLISQIETVVSRPRSNPMTGELSQPVPAEMLERGPGPRGAFGRAVAKPMSRDALAASADSYFTSLANNDGKNTPVFAPTCARWENGFPTTTGPKKISPKAPEKLHSYLDSMRQSCDEQQKSGVFGFVTEIRNRRFPLIDPERGIVLTFSFFEHNGTIREIKLNDGSTIPSPVKTPVTLEIAEVFKVDDGKIDQIEAVINEVPYGMSSDIWDKPK